MKRSILHFISLLAIGSLFLQEACQSPSDKTQKRPYEAWVIRSVLDKKPRMLSITLHDSLWVAYNTQTGSLYKAWKGKILFEGPVYTSAHGPQPTSVGAVYQEEPEGNPWKIISQGSEMIPEVIYKGHSIQDEQVSLQYELVYKGNRIAVEEKPEYCSVEGGRTGLERIFTTAEVPAGDQLALQTHLGPLQTAKDVETDGQFQPTHQKTEAIAGKSSSTLEGTLLLNSNATTRFTVKLFARPEQPAGEKEKLAGEEKVMALMAGSDCNTCHNKEVKTVGPAYVAIAGKYPNTPEMLNMLVSKVIKGGAGNWGEVPMTPHPNLAREDAATMVSYILNLDAEAEKAALRLADSKLMPKPDFDIHFERMVPGKIEANTEKPGMAINFYKFIETISGFPDINDEMLPMASGVMNALHGTGDELGQGDNFVIHASGFINLEKTTNVVFRLVSDDGSRLFIDSRPIINHDGIHGLLAKDGEMNLKAGKHPFRVEYYQGTGGKGLSLQWRPHGTKEFAIIPPKVFTFQGSQIKKSQDALVGVNKKAAFPGDGAPLQSVHPAFTLAQARPGSFQPKVGGMDFLPDGRMVVSTWDSLGSVYLLSGLQGKDPEAIRVKKIASGLAEPLGVKVVDGEIYVLQKQELTRLVDQNKDDMIDAYQTVCNGWKVSANFHEFAFGLVYQDGYFYGTLATAINPGGASTKPQIPDRGKVIKISKKDGSFEFIASGLRTPNGIGFGVDGEIFIADNQGDWLPASKILHLKPGAWYGSRSVDFKGTAHLQETPPVVWLPQDEIGNSPSQPALLNVGPYKNQMIHGDVTHGGLKRVFAEKINGHYQGVVFRFSQGLEAGINRLVWGPDGALYAGGVGSSGNWGHAGHLSYGLQKLTFNNKVPFEMLAVRAKSNGIEIEFTQPLKAGAGNQASDYNILQWWYQPTADYGGPKLDKETLTIKNIQVSSDRRKAFLELSGMKPRHMVYINLNRKTVQSSGNQPLWTTEAWYTMNNIPAQPGNLTQR